MKTLKLVALSAVVAGAMLTSCGGGVSTTPILKTETDSLWYANGAALSQQVFVRQLTQMGLVTDTMQVASGYYGRIAQEQDAVAKTKLEKEMKQKVDSVKSANAQILSAFFKGLEEGMSTDAKAHQARIVGMNMGSQVNTQMVPSFVQHVFGAEGDAKTHFSKNSFLSGVLTGMRNEKFMFDDVEVYAEAQAAKIQARAAQAKYGSVKEAGEKFLAENATKEGVVTLPSGVQYKILTESNGAKPTLESQVTCHYHGTLTDGTVFDSSVDRGEPATFAVGGVIAGWTEVLQLMSVGSKWTVYIPYDKAYGEAETGGPIKPYSALIFDIELLSIAK